MAIIDPNGLFLGERLGRCSDDAQLHFPRLYCAANNYARMELSYQRIVSKAYASFYKPPTEDRFWAMIREYRDNFLLFVFQHEGVWWGQWMTNERYLPRHKTAEDRRSPVPNQEELDAYRAQLIEQKKLAQRNHALADLREVTPTSAKLRTVRRAGVGVGVGVGVGENLLGEEPPRDESSLHKLCKEQIHAYWHKFHPGDSLAPWDGGEAKQLKSLLAANPRLTADAFQRLLDNRARSEVNHSKRPRDWIAKLTDFAGGPLNQYGQPLESLLLPPPKQLKYVDSNELLRR